jgi:hypothetical protein
MKFKVTKASDWDYKDEIEINTLEELIRFTESNGGTIIFDTDDNEIKIYDGYIE